MSNQWREEQNRCLRDIERHQEADKSYMDEGVQLLELVRNAQRLFAKQEPREKRRLLNFVLSNCYRTAPGRTARWSPRSANPLI
jgi:site-specific DNA recombinase